MSPKTKQTMSIIWHATMRGCTLAIGVLFLFFAIMTIATATSGKSEQGMTFSSLLTLTAFSLVISYAKEIFRAKSFSAPAQWLLNFFIVGLGFFFVILRSGMIANTRNSFYITGVIMYILVYLLIFGVTMLVKYFANKKARALGGEAQEEYVSRFTDN